MYLPSRAVMSEWQRAGVFGQSQLANYGAINNNNIPENENTDDSTSNSEGNGEGNHARNRRRPRRITIEELLELEERAQRIELFDPRSLDNITFTELVSAVIPSQMIGRAFLLPDLHDDQEFMPTTITTNRTNMFIEEEFELPADLILAWNVAIIFLLFMVGITLFITIMLFVKIQSSS